MHDCFISYASEDINVATEVQNFLEQNNIKCWICFRDITPGDDYAGSIVRAIKSSTIFICILSQNSLRSHHILNEINSALNAGIYILPLKIDDFDSAMESLNILMGAGRVKERRDFLFENVDFGALYD